MRIVDIRNANPVFVRQDFSDLRALKASIRQHGMRIPILLASDYLLIDGARRLIVAEELGWTEVPAVALSDWNTVCYYLEMAQVSKEHGWPGKQMTWLETADLANRILRPVYEDTRRARMSSRRRLNREAGTTGERLTTNRFNEDLYRALGFPSPHIFSCFREIGMACDRIQEKWGPEYAAHAREQVDVANRTGAEGKWELLGRLRHMCRVGPGVPEAAHRAADFRVAAEEVGRIERATNVITSACEALAAIEVNPAMDPSVAKRLKADLTKAIQPLHALRRRLQAHSEEEGIA